MYETKTPYQLRSIIFPTRQDLERTLLALADPKERNALLELKDHQENVLGQLEALHTSVSHIEGEEILSYVLMHGRSWT